MNIPSALHAFIETAGTLEKQAPSFRPGQLFFGRVQKLFPDQLAEIKLGSHTLLARLEAPLQAGHSYWLQVESLEGDVRLKVAASSESQEGVPDAGKLLARVGIPDSRETRQLIQMMQKEQLTMPKELLAKAGEWLKQSPDGARALQAVKLMAVRGLPFTAGVFQSLLAADAQESLTASLSRLASELSSVSLKSDTARELILFLTELKGNGIKGEGELLAEAIRAGAGTPGTASSLLKKLQAAGVMPEASSSAVSALARPVSGYPAAVLEALFQGQEPKLPNGKTISLTAAERQWVGDTVQSMQPLDGRDVKDFLKQGIRSAGLFYEGNLMMREADQSALKPLLVRFMKEAGNPAEAGAREMARQIVYRMNGQQILSFEDGPLQHIIMQFPLAQSGRQADVTLQWSGRKRENGQLDADYCRVLFYLDLETIKETVVDMQVQNRVVTVHVLNSHPAVREEAYLLIPALKSGLKEIGYELSSVHVQPPSAKGRANVERPYPQSMSYKGVDVRI